MQQGFGASAVQPVLGNSQSIGWMDPRLREDDTERGSSRGIVAPAKAGAHTLSLENGAQP